MESTRTPQQSGARMISTLFSNGTSAADSFSNSEADTVSINNQTYIKPCVAYLQSILPEEDLSAAMVHCRSGSENDAYDWWGSQGGQDWKPPPSRAPAPPPAAAPSASPSSSLDPTGSAPSYHPTLRDKLFVLRGTIYYDRNANGSRDSGVDDAEWGRDVEFDVGLGGVNLRLVECDLESNRAVETQWNPDSSGQGDADGEDGQGGEENWNSYSQAVSLGYDVLFHPKLADQSVDGGKYNMINIKVNRAYYIQAEAPAGYLFTGGVCNDSVPGWKCPSAGGNPGGEGASPSERAEALRRGREAYARNFLDGGENALGLRAGRSLRCVAVDRRGMPDGTLDLGAMRVGDVRLAGTEVRLNLDLGEVEKSVLEVKADEADEGGPTDRRSLLRSILSAFSTPQRQPRQLTSFQLRLLRRATPLGRDRYLLDDDDRYAIGVIAAEVLASSLDDRLARSNVELDHISAKEVVLSLRADRDEDDTEPASAAAGFAASDNDGDARDESDAGDRKLRDSPEDAAAATRPADRRPAAVPRRKNRLSVDLEVWGHYPPQLDVDFDYIVQQSINRETQAIREELKGYNANCDDQTEKVDDHGFLLDDFEEIHSNKGVVNTKRRRGNAQNREEEAAEGEAAEEEEQLFISNGGVFRTACSNAVKLPEYFEESLEEIEATSARAVIISEEESDKPILVIGLLSALLVVMLIVGFFIFRMGFKRKSDDEEEGHEYDYEDGSRTLSCSEQQRADEDLKRQMKRSSRRPASDPRTRKGFFQRKLGNVGTALNAERRRINARFGKEASAQTSHVDPENYGRRHTHATDRDEKSAMDKSCYAESVISAAQIALDDDHVDADERLKAFERRLSSNARQKPERIEEESHCDESTAASSRPMVPTNINFSQFEKKGSGKSSSDSSDSSEEEAPAKRNRQKGKKNAPNGDNKGTRRSDPARRKSRS